MHLLSQRRGKITKLHSYMKLDIAQCNSVKASSPALALSQSRNATLSGVALRDRTRARTGLEGIMFCYFRWFIVTVMARFSSDLSRKTSKFRYKIIKKCLKKVLKSVGNKSFKKEKLTHNNLS